MGKKKATGMSKRLGFTDRATIAENKDILRYNERLEREAKGLPPEEARRGGGGRPAGARRDRGGRPAAAAPPARAPRPPRPPALDDEQRATLEAALAAAVGESGFESAGQALIDRLAAHDSFERASGAGWEVAAGGGNAAERTEQEWGLLRKTWLTVRLALLEAYVTIKPELEPALARERKILARLDKPQRRQGRRGRPDVTAKKKGPRSDRPRRSGPPSPADVARKLAEPADAASAAEADVIASVLAVETASHAPIETADRQPEASGAAPDAQGPASTPPSGHVETEHVESAPGQELADELRREHGLPLRADASSDGSATADGDQNLLDLDL